MMSTDTASKDGVKYNMYLGQKFVKMTKINSNKFNSDEELEELLIQKH